MTSAAATHPGVDRSALRDLENKISELPLLPHVLVKILQLDRSSIDYFERFEALVMEDPPLAVRVIALANSSSSAPIEPVTTIAGAMTRVGAETIANLVASLSVQKVFVPKDPNQIALWEHSVKTAVISRFLAQQLPALGVGVGQAYLAGLLHDIGRFVMLEHAAPQFQAVDESNWSTPAELIQADVAIYKFTHSELGYLACRHWGLPETLASVIRQHHDDVGPPAGRDVAGASICLLQAADNLAMYSATIDDSSADSADSSRMASCLSNAGIHELGLSSRRVELELPKLFEESQTMLYGLGLGTAE